MPKQVEGQAIPLAADAQGTRIVAGRLGAGLATTGPRREEAKDAMVTESARDIQESLLSRVIARQASPWFTLGGGLFLVLAPTVIAYLHGVGWDFFSQCLNVPLPAVDTHRRQGDRNHPQIRKARRPLPGRTLRAAPCRC